MDIRAEIEALEKKNRELRDQVAYMKGYKAALQDLEQKQYNRHEVAVILAEAFGDDCACNFNGIDEWLPEKCELQESCPTPAGVACWEQYLKHKE